MQVWLRPVLVAAACVWLQVLLAASSPGVVAPLASVTTWLGEPVRCWRLHCNLVCADLHREYRGLWGYVGAVSHWRLYSDLVSADLHNECRGVWGYVRLWGCEGCVALWRMCKGQFLLSLYLQYWLINEMNDLNFDPYWALGMWNLQCSVMNGLPVYYFSPTQF